MLRSARELEGYTIRATDGNIGSMHTFYFDDLTWTIRYLVADTGGWLIERQVLLSTVSLGRPDWEGRIFPVDLTREQVKNSPDIAVDRPVSRQMEKEIHTYYGWPPYWTGAAALTEAQVAARVGEEAEEQATDPHLRSTKEVAGYHIQAIDGEIGHVEDFVVDDKTWVIRYIVVDTRNWLPGRRVLVAPTWIQDINWATRKVVVDLHRETIKDSPEFDPSRPVNREYEVRLYDYYGRPKYWSRV